MIDLGDELDGFTDNEPPRPQQPTAPQWSDDPLTITVKTWLPGDE